MNQLFEIQKNIKALEKQKKQMIEAAIKSLSKPINEWAKLVPVEKFKRACLHWFAENFNHQQGTNYFTWLTTESIQNDFEVYIKEELKSSVPYYFIPIDYSEKFFYLKKVGYGSTARSIKEMETSKIEGTEDNPIIVYQYSGVTFDGFNLQLKSVQQRLEIDLNKSCVIRYDDSKKRFKDESPGTHRLSTDFISKLI